MKRREFIAALCGTAIARPSGLRAQQARPLPQIGWLSIDVKNGLPREFQFLRRSKGTVSVSLRPSRCQSYSILPPS
jgi:hypothetical protein